MNQPKAYLYRVADDARVAVIEDDGTATLTIDALDFLAAQAEERGLTHRTHGRSFSVICRTPNEEMEWRLASAPLVEYLKYDAYLP